MNSESVDYKPSGCCRTSKADQKNNNTSSHSCCKLDSYNWLENIDDILGDNKFNLVEVRFKNSRKDFYSLEADMKFEVGDIVAVEASPGHDIGIVSLTGETAKLQYNRKRKKSRNNEIKKVYRLARESDIDKWKHAQSLENDTMVGTRKIVMSLGLNMKINDVEYQGDGTKAIFYYTAEERVDFRKLIRLLADEFMIRIEMKQIGVRQESARLGGIGPCGRELCCSSWMSNFKSVSTTSARSQDLSLNPQKLAGQCGKLKCCLNFEQETYTEQIKTFPNTRINLQTKKGEAIYIKKDILKGQMWYAYAGTFDGLIQLSKEDVISIQEMNRKGDIPETIEEFSVQPVEEGIKFDKVIGQDDLTRFDNVKSKKSKQKNRRKSNRRNQSSKPKQASGPRNQNKGNKDHNKPTNNAGESNSRKPRNNARNRNNAGSKNPNRNSGGRPQNKNSRNKNQKPSNNAKE